MRHLHIDDPDQRFRDVFVNYLELTQGGKIGLVPLEEGGSGWVELFTHLLEEYRLRFGDYPAGFRDGLLAEANIPRPDHPDAGIASVTVAAHPLPGGTFLAKYGRTRHLERALERGEILISPASSYEDSSLDPARRADELKVSIQIPGEELEIRIIDEATGKPIETLPQPAWVTYTRGTRADFYVYCLSAAWKPQLFLDFQADACLLITNPRIFLNRLVQVVVAKLPSGSQVGQGPRCIL